MESYRNNPLPERWAKPRRDFGGDPFRPQQSARLPWRTSPRGEPGGDISCPRRPATRKPPQCLWVSQIGDSIVGIVRLIEERPGVARIVTFRIDPDWYHTPVVANLVRTVEEYCRQHGCCKVLVGFGVAPPWMPSVLRRHGFRVHWRSQTWEATLDP